jgi:hypothetical protein
VTEVEEKLKQIHANILAAQSRQKSYTDKRCSPLEFEVGDHIYLRGEEVPRLAQVPQGEDEIS